VNVNFKLLVEETRKNVVQLHRQQNTKWIPNNGNNISLKNLELGFFRFLGRTFRVLFELQPYLLEQAYIALSHDTYLLNLNPNTATDTTPASVVAGDGIQLKHRNIDEPKNGCCCARSHAETRSSRVLRHFRWIGMLLVMF